MSRHTFHTTHLGRPIEVSAGWDRPLQGFFLTVIYTDDLANNAAYEYAFNNLDAEVAWPPRFRTFLDVLENLKIGIPSEMSADIKADGAANMGNKIRNWNK